MFLLAFFPGLAAHMDPLVILFILGVTGLFRLLSGKSHKPAQPDQPSAPQLRPELPRREVSSDNDEERIRRFLEALGQPPSAEPPPPVRPRPLETLPQQERVERARTVRPRRNLLNPLPPLTTAPPPLPRPVRQLPGQIKRAPYEEKTFVAPAVETPIFEVQGQGGPAVLEPASTKTPGDAYAIATIPAAAMQTPSSLADELRAPGTLRRAILLREILGPPRALQPLEL